MRYRLIGHGITKFEIANFEAASLYDAAEVAVRECTPGRNVAIHAGDRDKPECTVFWDPELGHPRFDHSVTIAQSGEEDICPECAGAGWTIDHDPLHPDAGGDGDVPILCTCPIGEEMAALLDAMPISDT